MVYKLLYFIYVFMFKRMLEFIFKERNDKFLFVEKILFLISKLKKNILIYLYICLYLYYLYINLYL